MGMICKSSSPLKAVFSYAATVASKNSANPKYPPYFAPFFREAHALMRLVPVTSDPHVYLQRHRKIRSADHVCPCLSYERLHRLVGDLEHQLIVHLHDEPRRNARTLQPRIHLDHGALDDVRGRPLHG